MASEEIPNKKEIATMKVNLGPENYAMFGFKAAERGDNMEKMLGDLRVLLTPKPPQPETV